MDKDCALTSRIAGLKDPFIGKTCQTVVQLFGLVSAFYFVEKVGRRAFVLTAPLGLAALNFVIGGMGFLPNSSAVGSALISLSVSGRSFTRYPWHPLVSPIVAVQRVMPDTQDGPRWSRYHHLAFGQKLPLQLQRYRR
jgi:hypothetical protein